MPIIDPSIRFETQEETLYIKSKSARLCIGIPNETDFLENRVALIPEAVNVLVNNGHEVLIESKAGEGCRYSDKDFSEAGAQIVYDREKVYQCPILIKSAPVLEEELPLFKPGQIIMSPLHHASLTKRTLEELSKKKITAISFEDLKDDSGTYPIVRTMSEIAGSAAMLIAGEYLACENGGKGVLLGGISGIPPTKVIIIGAGVVGEYAVRTALALGASVKIFDNNVYRLKRLQNNLGARLWTSVIEPNILAKQLKTCEVAVGALSSEKGRTPIIVTEEMVARMRPGSVIIDISIDRGGCFETSVPTTLQNPVYTKHDVIHYCVPNINSGFARTASQAISNVLMPMLIEIGDEGGFESMIWADINLRSGVYLYKGHLTNFYISERFGMKYTDLNLLIASKR
ncbi:MAG: alanine dehydrogenase [Pseudopedobacter saltans]|uniref:alanine dehydrogenase n=1 Tax=Pseudopedobacter saltans TaxID=151895 RepID=A0A2W5GUK2_9SPHI|nr:MAG: alanine dehydrogenase [Pseudopedobacter saltans]